MARQLEDPHYPHYAEHLGGEEEEGEEVDEEGEKINFSSTPLLYFSTNTIAKLP